MAEACVSHFNKTYINKVSHGINRVDNRKKTNFIYYHLGLREK